MNPGNLPSPFYHKEYGEFLCSDSPEAEFTATKQKHDIIAGTTFCSWKAYHICPQAAAVKNEVSKQ